MEAYQLFKARASGADAVLLIAAVLPNKDLSYLVKSARKLGMHVLIEVRRAGYLTFIRQSVAPPAPSYASCTLTIGCGLWLARPHTATAYA